MNQLFETSEEVLSLAALGGEPITPVNGKRCLVHTAEHYLKSRGFASTYDEAHLIISITTCYLVSNFLEEYPPILASLEGQFVEVDSVFLEHKDQLHLCTFGWPLKDQTEYSQFFEYAQTGVFGPMAIFDRFPFINAQTGEICVKNGSHEFLVNFTGFDEGEAKTVIDLAKRLAGFVLCWKEYPDDADFRSFLSLLEVNDTFTRAIDYAFGSAIEVEQSWVEGTKRPRGRPSKKGMARDAYWQCFPDGHVLAGKSWKKVHDAVEGVLEMKIDISTLKRAIREGRK